MGSRDGYEAPAHLTLDLRNSFPYYSTAFDLPSTEAALRDAAAFVIDRRRTLEDFAANRAAFDVALTE